MKSTVPATLVLRPSVPNRVIWRIPDSPAVRRRQLSDLPAPSEVTRPLPVTTTIGRPALSRMLPMCSPVSLLLACFTGKGRDPLQHAPLYQESRPSTRLSNRGHESKSAKASGLAGCAKLAPCPTKTHVQNPKRRGNHGAKVGRTGGP